MLTKSWTKQIEIYDLSLAYLRPRSQAVSGRRRAGVGGVFSISGDFRVSSAASIAFKWKK